MRFKKGANVVTRNGRQAGVIDRVVIEPKSKMVTDLVVRKGWLFPEDKVIPIDQVMETTKDEDNVVLNEDIDLDALLNYEELHYVVVDEEERAKMDYSATYASPLYAYPPYTFASLPPTGARPGAPTYRVEEELSIPEDTVALAPGIRVVTSDGTHVGNVEEVLTESTTQEATHFIVSQGLIFTERKMVPTAWVDRITKDEVTLWVSARQLEHLPAYRGRNV